MGCCCSDSSAHDRLDDLTGGDAGSLPGRATSARLPEVIALAHLLFISSITQHRAMMPRHPNQRNGVVVSVVPPQLRNTLAESLAAFSMLQQKSSGESSSSAHLAPDHISRILERFQQRLCQLVDNAAMVAAGRVSKFELVAAALGGAVVSQLSGDADDNPVGLVTDSDNDDDHGVTSSTNPLSSSAARQQQQQNQQNQQPQTASTTATKTSFFSLVHRGALTAEQQAQLDLSIRIALSNSGGSGPFFLQQRQMCLFVLPLQNTLLAATRDSANNPSMDTPGLNEDEISVSQLLQAFCAEVANAGNCTEIKTAFSFVLRCHKEQKDYDNDDDVQLEQLEALEELRRNCIEIGFELKQDLEQSSTLGADVLRCGSGAANGDDSTVAMMMMSPRP